MEITDAQDFISENHRGVMSTFRKDGMPQLSPINLGIDAEGRVIVSTREPAYKTRNLRRDPRVSICVIPDKFYGKWIQIEGTAEILTLPAALEPLVDYYKRTWGEHPDWDEYRDAMVKEQRVLLRITIERAGPTVRG